MLGKPHPPSGFPLVKWKDLPGSPGSSDMYCSGEHPFFSLSHSQSCRSLCWAFPLPGDQSTPSLSQMTHGIPASQSSWTKWSKVAILSLLTLAQCLSTLGPQNPRETHSVEINEHLLPQTHLLFSSLRNSTQMYASLSVLLLLLLTLCNVILPLSLPQSNRNLAISQVQDYHC